MFNVSLPRFIALPLLAVGASLISGCNSVQPTTFNFIVDMPPGFKYKAVVNYITAPGETCTVARKENKADVYNDIWREGYKPSIDIELRRMINNCPLIMRSVRIEVFSVYGKDRDAFGTDKAFIFLRDENDDGYKLWNKPFDATGVTLVEGQCQSLFRTMGKPRILRKLLSCKNINAQGVLENQVPTGAYTFEQLAGNTVKLKLTWGPEDKPYFKGFWLKTSEGWRPCTGRWDTPNEELCTTPPKFTDFVMVDGRRCTVYPDCTPRKENE